jgi:hypothetical protein
MMMGEYEKYQYEIQSKGRVFNPRLYPRHPCHPCQFSSRILFDHGFLGWRGWEQKGPPPTSRISAFDDFGGQDGGQASRSNNVFPSAKLSLLKPN